jgi:hypothetical protein
VCEHWFSPVCSWFPLRFPVSGMTGCRQLARRAR